MIDRKIIVGDEEKSILMSHYNCSKDTVNKALNFKRHGSKSRAIRNYAVNFLGGLIKDDIDKYL